MKKLFVIVALLLGTLPVFGLSLTDDELSAQRLYIQAVSHKGDLDQVKKAEMAYRKLLKKEHTNLYYQLRIASLTAVKAKHTFWPHEKMGFVNEGVRLFDRIERKVKAKNIRALSYEFHLYRGRTYINFPGFLKKRKLALADLEKVAILAKQLKRPKEELGPFYLAYAQALYKDGQKKKAKDYCNLALNNTLSDYELKAAKKLLRKR